MNSIFQKVIKSQQIFPSDEGAFKLVYLAILETCAQSICYPLRESSPSLASRL
ncbi:MAG TPA: IS256 family transposase, partial [Pseudanabaena sp.]|nr:IS256 family transposase [Pseudanabaena sp.]